MAVGSQPHGKPGLLFGATGPHRARDFGVQPALDASPSSHIPSLEMGHLGQTTSPFPAPQTHLTIGWKLQIPNIEWFPRMHIFTHSIFMHSQES